MSMTKDDISKMLTTLGDVIVKEPNQDNRLNPFNAEWNKPYFNSVDSILDGIVYCCCGCICAGIFFARTGDHFCTCLCPGSTMALRTKIRMAYGIKGSLFEDCATTLLPPCYFAQIKNELDQKNVADPFN